MLYSVWLKLVAADPHKHMIGNACILILWTEEEEEDKDYWFLEANK